MTDTDQHTETRNDQGYNQEPSNTWIWIILVLFLLIILFFAFGGNSFFVSPHTIVPELN